MATRHSPIFLWYAAWSSSYLRSHSSREGAWASAELEAEVVVDEDEEGEEEANEDEAGIESALSAAEVDDVEDAEEAGVEPEDGVEEDEVADETASEEVVADGASVVDDVEPEVPAGAAKSLRDGASAERSNGVSPFAATPPPTPSAPADLTSVAASCRPALVSLMASAYISDNVTDSRSTAASTSGAARLTAGCAFDRGGVVEGGVEGGGGPPSAIVGPSSSTSPRGAGRPVVIRRRRTLEGRAGEAGDPPSPRPARLRRPARRAMSSRGRKTIEVMGVGIGKSANVDFGRLLPMMKARRVRA